MSEHAGEKVYPKVGVAAILIRDGKVLVGKRKGLHGSGTWSFPGGHLEFGEDIAAAVARETLEETGLRVRNAKFVAITNDVQLENSKHYVTLFYKCEPDDGEPVVMEPDKCEEWRWVVWNEIPQPRFFAVKGLLDAGYNPFAEKD
jgi:8-oxo-dGTP diphosphatase